MIKTKILIRTSKILHPIGEGNRYSNTQNQSADQNKLTRSGIAGDGAGDDEDSSTDGSANADQNEIEEAEAADKSVARNRPAGGVIGRRSG